jgi:hypothetical protein
MLQSKFEFNFPCVQTELKVKPSRGRSKNLIKRNLETDKRRNEKETNIHK